MSTSPPDQSGVSGVGNVIQRLAALHRTGETVPRDRSPFAWEPGEAVRTLDRFVAAARLEESRRRSLAELVRRIDFETWPTHMTCNEADDVAEVLRYVAGDDAADDLLLHHAEVDDPAEGDRHAHLRSRRTHEPSLPTAPVPATATDYEAACQVAATAPGETARPDRGADPDEVPGPTSGGPVLHLEAPPSMIESSTPRTTAPPVSASPT